MQYRLLGRTGVRVSELSLGAMSFGSLGNADHDDCVRIIHAALDAGVNCIDTADIYSKGESEEIVGRALRGRRQSVVLSSKCYWPMSDDPNERGLSRRWIVSAVEASLRRLESDYLDIFFLHKPDEHTDLSESLETASDLVRAGKVRFIGTSSYPAYQLVQAQWEAQRRHLTAPRVEQPAYSLLARSIERDVLPVCLEYGTGVMAAAPLNSGWLMGNQHWKEAPSSVDLLQTRRRDREADRMKRPEAQAKLDRVEALSNLAHVAKRSMISLALAFVLEHPGISTAVVGPRTMAQLDEQLSASLEPLDHETLDHLDDIVLPGTDVDPADRWYQPPGLRCENRRRTSHWSGSS